MSSSPPPHTLSLSLLTGSIPATFMLSFTILGLNLHISENIAGALQHFAAGLLLSAVGCELLPTVLAAEGWRENISATVGFFSGMGLLIALGVILPGQEEEEGGEGVVGGGSVEGSSSIMRCNNRPSHIAQELRQSSTMSTMSSSMRGRIFRSSSIRGSARMIHEEYSRAAASSQRSVAIIQEGVRNGANGGDHHHPPPPHESQPLIIPIPTGISTTTTTTPFPLSFLIAILLDSLLDGFLIGITTLNPTTSIILSASLSVEMSFLGLTLATACRGMPPKHSLPLSLAGPVVLVLGSGLGGFLAGGGGGDDVGLGEDPVWLAGIMGFGTSALLFMVAEELLLEAHEGGGGHVWWVDLQLYVGFYWGVMGGKLFRD